MLACLCLNITIETNADDFEKVTPESLELSEEERSDKFFKQNIQKIGYLDSVSIVHPCLTRKRNLGAWTITRCVNCDCLTHAVRRRKGASMVVIYSKLLDSSAISSVKSSDIFSTIYNIVVNPNDIDLDIGLGRGKSPVEGSDTVNYFNVKIPPLRMDHSATPIRDVMTEFIRKKTVSVEQRIKKYTDEQYDRLNYWKDRAFKEHESLSRVLSNEIEEETKPLGYGFFTPIPPLMQPAKQTESKHHGDPDALTEGAPGTSWKPLIPDKSSFARYTDTDELMFEFESDEASSVISTDVDESDREDKEEGISIPRSAPARPNLAKSLPMNIPTFISKSRQGLGEDDVEASPVGENVDIAASMKALAKSVHGDSVFGDLPRPRFSSQI